MTFFSLHVFDCGKTDNAMPHSFLDIDISDKCGLWIISIDDPVDKPVDKPVINL